MSKPTAYAPKVDEEFVEKWQRKILAQLWWMEHFKSSFTIKDYLKMMLREAGVKVGGKMSKKLISMKELSPCPFCGSKKLVQDCCYGASIECEDCGCSGPISQSSGYNMSKKQARVLWNKRTCGKSSVLMDKYQCFVTRWV